MKSSPSPQPIALVLGAAVWPGGEASPTLRRRAEHAARLWHDGQISAVLCCGGIGKHPPSEAQVIAEICRSQGVPSDRLLLEQTSRSTEENILLSLPILADRGGDVLIVTDRWHAPRALLVARRAGMPARAAVLPWRGARPKAVLKAGLREIPAYLGYWLRGAGRPR